MVDGSQSIHKDIGESEYFVENVKRFQRHDEITAYDMAMLNELEVDCATFKSFQGYVEKYNIVNDVQLNGNELHENTFRNAWFKSAGYRKVCTTVRLYVLICFVCAYLFMRYFEFRLLSWIWT